VALTDEDMDDEAEMGDSYISSDHAHDVDSVEAAE
jgi:hypothetical protein